MGQSFNKETLSKTRQTVIAKGHVSATDCYVDHAEGALVWDIEGREYIDFAGGIAVMNVGHSHPKVIAAIKAQSEKFTHTCFMVLPYEPAIRLAERLGVAVPGDFSKSTLFVNSGAEAVENAVKIARYYTKRSGIIAFENAFHGRTYLGMGLTSKVKPYKYGFGPLVPEIYRMPYAYCYRCSFGMKYPECQIACADNLNNFLKTYVAPEQTAAIIVEPVQGEGGFITPPPEYFLRLKSICDKHGILFIADEIQTGMGRTGTMFAMEHYGVDPDLTTVAKSLAAGMPLSAVVGKKEIMDSVHPGGIGGTYGGNPLSCAAALSVFEIFDTEGILQKSKILGEKLSASFNDFQEKFEIIGDVRGIGPMMAIELVKDRTTKEPATDQTKALVEYCYDKGLILLACGGYSNVIRALMPLVITDKQLERGLDIIEDGLRVVTQ